MNVPYQHMHAFADEIARDLVSSENEYPCGVLHEGITEQWKLDLIQVVPVVRSAFEPPEAFDDQIHMINARIHTPAVFDHKSKWVVEDISTDHVKKEVEVKMKRRFASFKGLAAKELKDGKA